MCYKLESPLHDFKTISDKGFLLMEQIISAYRHQNTPGSLLAVSFLMGQGADETSFLEPKTVSKMKTLLQVPLRKSEKNRWKTRKEKTRKREAEVKENWKDRGEYGETNSVVNTSNQMELERGIWWAGIIRLEPYLSHIGRYLKKLLLCKGRVH